MHKSSDGKISPVNYWDLELLKERLLHKHAETFWIDVNKKVINGIEHFLYAGVTHTKSPIADYFGPLIESNVITMDYTLHRKESGMTRDHGYLFKILPEDLELLFPPPVKYDLTTI
jgi:3',5'-cyclic AMP phosphodiesterase CpdA